MVEEETKSQKVIESSEAYDLVAMLGFSYLHMGGSKATQDLLEMCQLNEKSKVLDIGCGTGYTVCEIARKKGSHVTGIDISEKMITTAKETARKEKLEDNVEFQVADVCQLPFADESFDVVIFESVLTPLAGDKNRALKEIVRVVRRGGRVGGNEGFIDPATPPELLEDFERHPSFTGTLFTIQKLKDMFESLGLQVIHVSEGKGIPNPIKEMGLRGLLSFMVRKYPKLLLRLMRDSRLREYIKVDERVNKTAKKYGGYVLIVGQKPE